jgi:uncharacterized protein YwqG
MASLAESVRSAWLLRPASAGTSRLGGLPRTPADWPWPTTTDGRSLSFLAQFDLNAEQARTLALPRPGLLTFFFDSVGAPWLSDGDSVCVRCFADSSSSYRSSPDDCDLFDEVRVELVPTEVPRLGTPDPHTVHEHQRLLEALDPRTQPLSFLGGHALPLQEPMEDSCAEREPRVPPSQWRLLLQLDTDPRPGFSWGSGSGRLYIWVPDADLRLASFDRVVAIIQDT